MFKRKRCTLFIGMFLGFLVAAGISYALIMGRTDELSYDPTNTWWESTNVQDALDELYNQKGCPLGQVCINKSHQFEVGDYILYSFYN